MDENKVLDVVIAALQFIAAKHKKGGRHELNRTDLETAIDELKLLGLPAPEPTEAERMAAVKARAEAETRVYGAAKKAAKDV